MPNQGLSFIDKFFVQFQFIFVHQTQENPDRKILIKCPFFIFILFFIFFIQVITLITILANILMWK